jgi:hypothetical protein
MYLLMQIFIPLKPSGTYVNTSIMPPALTVDGLELCKFMGLKCFSQSTVIISLNNFNMTVFAMRCVVFLKVRSKF